MGSTVARFIFLRLTQEVFVEPASGGYNGAYIFGEAANAGPLTAIRCRIASGPSVRHHGLHRSILSFGSYRWLETKSHSEKTLRLWFLMLPARERRIGGFRDEMASNCREHHLIVRIGPCIHVAVAPILSLQPPDSSCGQPALFVPAQRHRCVRGPPATTVDAVLPRIAQTSEHLSGRHQSWHGSKRKPR